ncbi:MAG: serine hydrolase [Synechococcales cyanobacterium RM1_1_8]|nr:serine hydrolase [Synechococcales cyanobacterium RM1_1_8]
MLSSLDPSLRYNSQEAHAAPSEAAKPPSTALELTREMPALASQLQGLIAAQADLTASVMVVDLERQSYVNLDASRSFSSASTIKLPILVALLEAVEAGNVSLEESLTMAEEDIVGEAGEMQFQPPGTQFSVLKTATEMIRISDNTATNLLIKRLGGPEQLNARFRSWGLQQTQLQALLPDLDGLNTTSPKDLVTLLGRLNRGDLLSAGGRDRLFGILRTTETSDLLPQGLGPGATIAHKTGNIGKAIGDVGLVTMPSGKPYVIMAMVERPHGDERADALIRSLSSATYNFLESTEQQSEQLVPPNVPRSNIADRETKPDASMMMTEPQPPGSP